MINTREIAEEYRLTHWAQVMQERAQSGLSIKAYCKQSGICSNTYFYWQRRVRAAAATELGLRVCDAQNQPHVSFSEVRVAEDTACLDVAEAVHWQAGVKNILSAILTSLLGHPNPSKICCPRFLKHACRRGFLLPCGLLFLHLRAKKQSGKVTLSAPFRLS